MATRPRPRPRLSPSALVMVIALLVALVVAVSGIVGAITDTHDHSPISRPVFFNIPGALEAVFYTLTTLLFAAAGWLFVVRVQNWERGQPDRRATTPRTIKRRLEDLRSGLYMQTLLRDPAAGIMHSLIYFPFLILFAVTTVLEVDHQLPDSAKFLHGTVYQGYKLVGDTAGDPVPDRDHLGHPPPLRGPALPHPDQDEAGGWRHPRHVLRHRRHRPVRAGRAYRPGGPAQLREVGLHRLPAVLPVQERPPRRPADRSTRSCGRSMSPPSSSSWSWCRRPSCVTCSPRR